MSQPGVYNAFATIGRVDSVLSAGACCVAAVVCVGYLLYKIQTDKTLRAQKPVATALAVSLGVCMCACGLCYAVAAQKSRHVAALGGLWAFMR
jgi:hypothetical protein